MSSAGLGQRLARTWRDKHYDNRRLDAATLIYTKAPQIIRAFDEGAVIRAKRGRFLAIPTENAPRKGTDGRRISPSTSIEAVPGAPAIKDATLIVTVDYETSAPLT